MKAHYSFAGTHLLCCSLWCDRVDAWVRALRHVWSAGRSGSSGCSCIVGLLCSARSCAHSTAVNSSASCLSCVRRRMRARVADVLLPGGCPRIRFRCRRRCCGQPERRRDTDAAAAAAGTATAPTTTTHDCCSDLFSATVALHPSVSPAGEPALRDDAHRQNCFARWRSRSSICSEFGHRLPATRAAGRTAERTCTAAADAEHVESAREQVASCCNATLERAAWTSEGAECTVECIATHRRRAAASTSTLIRRWTSPACAAVDFHARSAPFVHVTCERLPLSPCIHPRVEASQTRAAATAAVATSHAIKRQSSADHFNECKHMAAGCSALTFVGTAATCTLCCPHDANGEFGIEHTSWCRALIDLLLCGTVCFRRCRFLLLRRSSRRVECERARLPQSLHPCCADHLFVDVAAGPERINSASHRTCIAPATDLRAENELG